ncbi:MAG TPA: hypothetical protein VFB15_05310 [Candidatus Binataceae bacterium]|nr:hypothetical protein [Candidatus Binataceae bacterium]
MWLVRLMAKVSNFYRAHVFWRKVESALALHQRGEARADGLEILSAKTVLQIEWLARAIHPWDRDLPPSAIERRFAKQCLTDTDAALKRLFDEIPILDRVEIAVRRAPTRPPLIRGTVQRKHLNESRAESVGMRLRALGLGFRMSNLGLEEMESP